MGHTRSWLEGLDSKIEIMMDSKALRHASTKGYWFDYYEEVLVYLNQRLKRDCNSVHFGRGK